MDELELQPGQAQALGPELLNLGVSRDDMATGQMAFEAGHRAEWKIR